MTPGVDTPGPLGCGPTHHPGCPCHEAKRDAMQNALLTALGHLCADISRTVDLKIEWENDIAISTIVSGKSLRLMRFALTKANTEIET